MTESRPKIRPRLPIVSALLFIDMLGFSALIPVLPELKDQLGVSDLAMGILLAGLPLGTALTTLPIGRLTDVIGPRRTTIGGAIGVGATVLAFAFVPPFGWLLAVRLLQGLASPALWVAGPAWVAIGNTEGRARRLATTTGAGMAGSIVGAAVGGWMAASFGLLSAFVVLGALSIVAAGVALVMTTRPEIPPRVEVRMLEAFALGFRSLRFRVGAFSTLLAAVIGAAEAALITLALGDRGLDERQLGLWLSIGGAALVIGQVTGPRIAGRIGIAPTLVLAGTLGAAAAMATALWTSTASLIGLLIALPLLTGWMYGLSLELLAGGAEESGSTAAIGISWWNLTWAIGATVGPVLITWSLQTGGEAWSLALVAGVSLVVAVAVGASGPRLRSRP